MIDRLVRLSVFQSIIIVGLLVFASPALTANCTWTGVTSIDWHTTGNWSGCGGGIPSSTDDVSIPGSGVTNEPTISSADVTISSLVMAVGRTLSINTVNLTLSDGSSDNYGTVTGSGTVRTQGTGFFSNQGAFSPGLEILSGTTGIRGTFDGTIEVALGATLEVFQDITYPFIANGNVTVNGNLIEETSSSIFYFDSVTLINNGTIGVKTYFDLGGSQTLTGSGSFTAGVYVQTGSTLTLGSDNQMKLIHIFNGGTLSVGNFTLTLVNGFSNIYGTVTGIGTVRTHGTVRVSNYGTFTPNLEIISDTTEIFGTFGGTIDVASGAILEVYYHSSYPFIANENVTVNGTITEDLSSSTFDFDGATLTNNGTVGVKTYFDRGGAQTMTGSGSFTSSAYVRSGSTITLGSDHQMKQVYIYSGGTMSVGSFTLTLSNGYSTNYGTVSGTGTVRTQGTGRISNYGIFNPSLEVISDTTEAFGTFNGAITVAPVATLESYYSSSNPLVANGDVTVNGTISEGSSSSTFDFDGATLTNNGAVGVKTYFDRGGVQTLTGSGIFNGSAYVRSGSTLTFGSDHQMRLVSIYPGGALDITGRYLYLSASGTPLINNGTLTTTGSTIIYNGTTAQTVATTNVDYSSLGIDDLIGVSLTSAETVPGTLFLTKGVFTIGSYLTMGEGATISRGAGSLSAVPTFGTSVNVEYTGSSSITTSYELPTSTTALANLTFNNSGGVFLDVDVMVNRTLALTSGDIRTGAYTLSMPPAGTSTGNADVVGNVKRIGPFSSSTAYSFGNPLVTINFSAGGSLPTDVVIALNKEAPADFLVAVTREYTVTPNGGSGFAATLRLHYLDLELNGNEEEILDLWRFDGAQWSLQPKTASNTTNNWLERSGVSAFSRWTIAKTLCYTLTTSADPSEGGSVSANPSPNCESGTKYTHGTEVQLTANANHGYALDYWGGDVSGSTSPTSITMTSDKTVTAYYIPQYYIYMPLILR